MTKPYHPTPHLTADEQAEIDDTKPAEISYLSPGEVAAKFRDIKPGKSKWQRRDAK